MAEEKKYFQNFIDGAWVDGGAGRLDVINPATGEVLAEQALADDHDVDRAVQAARRVHLEAEFFGLRPVERGRMVQAMGNYLLAHADEIAESLTLEQGKPLWESHIEIKGAARYFEYYGNQAETLEGRSIPLGSGYLDFTVLEPYGVSAQIIPWNFPLEMGARSVSAGLACGNACVVKTAELTPITNAWIGKAAEAVGIPNGAVNIICGIGEKAGAALASHPKVNQIVFTGSVATGKSIAKAASQNIVPCVLELGGKSAAIVFDDVNMDNFENDVRWGIFFNAGQVCSAMSRVVIDEKIHNEFVGRAEEIANKISVGPGIEREEQGFNMGSMVSDAQRDRAVEMVRNAVQSGAKLITGGHVSNQPGAFMEPTVLADVTPDMEIAHEEVFGPVLSVMKFSGESEAVEIANGTDYGLVGGVFTGDLDRATKVASKMRAGQIFVNEWFAGGVETPFGGYGKSGYGREKGREALLNYVQTKNVAIKVR